MVPRIAALLYVVLTGSASAQTPDRVLLVINDNSPLSRAIGDYYSSARHIPPKNICHLKTSPDESIERSDYTREVERPIGVFLRKQGLEEIIYYIATTAGV